MKISMMEAYRIEQLKLETNTYQAWQAAVNEIDELIYNFNEDEFIELYEGRYEIHFVTMNGLKNLLNMRYGITSDHYIAMENGLDQVPLSKEQINSVRKWISPNWTIEESANGFRLYVKGK